MKIFGHEFGGGAKKPLETRTEAAPATTVNEVVANETAPVVAAENIEVAASAAEQKVAPANPEAAKLGEQADKLAAMIDAEAAANGGLDEATPSIDAAIPTVAEQVAALDESALTTSEGEYKLPEQILADNTGLLRGQETIPAEQTSQVEASAPSTEVTVDPVLDAPAVDGKDLWEDFNKTAPTTENPEASSTPNPEQNQ